MSYTFFRLVKTLNDIGFIATMHMNFSFLGLINLTRSDSYEGWTYITSICYPCQACVKINGVLTRNGEGKLEVFHQLYSLEVTCRS